ncbi:hypothetical protein [Streptococcus equi]|uniref:hypothetical protein n=1 Tax=Streptococcus equi TaxID=1336 RepID=UPI0005B87480|nr:hypothetical protein [Streptococcus equi]MCD3375424.1 hypothetical protein [Streptococcus equi subsp. zooepidemicus]
MAWLKVRAFKPLHSSKQLVIALPVVGQVQAVSFSKPSLTSVQSDNVAGVLGAIDDLETIRLIRAAP